jgi:hypothetical protein
VPMYRRIDMSQADFQKVRQAVLHVLYRQCMAHCVCTAHAACSYFRYRELGDTNVLNDPAVCCNAFLTYLHGSAKPSTHCRSQPAEGV